MTPDDAAALRAPFDPELISYLPAGKGRPRLAYIGHADVTDRLLSVDPEWSWEPMATHPEHGGPVVDSHGGLWILLTVCGVTRPGYGDPQNAGSSNAVKEAISDAIRNGAMRFGVGLDLWRKDQDLPPATDRPVTRTKPTQPEDDHWTRDDLVPPSTPTAVSDDDLPVPSGHNQVHAKGASSAQIRLIQVLLSDAGYKDNQAKYDRMSIILDKTVNSSRELTTREASLVIEALQVEVRDGTQ